ncbi:MAG: hypothetical protein ABI191_03205 [Rhizomicrobium sp.]
MKLNHVRDDSARETDIQDSIHDMPEPPGALGDIVRRMKRRANAERSAGLRLPGAATREW